MDKIYTYTIYMSIVIKTFVYYIKISARVQEIIYVPLFAYCVDLVSAIRHAILTWTLTKTSSTRPKKGAMCMMIKVNQRCGVGEDPNETDLGVQDLSWARRQTCGVWDQCH
jgi:hypothetical protein